MSGGDASGGGLRTDGGSFEGARAVPGVTLYVAVSLDGFIARKDGSMDWLATDVDYGFHAFMDTVDAVIMGRKTFEFILGHGSWPYGEVPGTVLTRGDVKNPFSQVTVSAAPPSEVVATLRGQGCDRIWLVGGGVALQTFLDEGLVDRLALYTVPVLLGSGIPLFPGGSTEHWWDLAGMRSFTTGVTEAVYDVRRAQAPGST